MISQWSAAAGRLFDLGSYRTASVNDYTDVLVPLDEAYEYSYSARSGTGAPAEYAPANTSEEDDAETGESSSKRDDDEYSIEGLRRAVRQATDGKQPQRFTDYELKSKLINKAIQDIGMGRYNWQLFFLCGFGWFADNLWMQGVSLILPSLSAEFGIAEKTVRYTTSALFLGLCFGSFFWGIGSDVMGRRLAFNCTLLITSVFGTLAAYASSWGMVCVLVAALGFGVGGNLPVDGALFLEFLPDASSSLLTLLSVWWPVGQLCSSLIAWLLIAGHETPTSTPGPEEHVRAVRAAAEGASPAWAGWRKFIMAIGILTFVMFFIRFFVFRLFESPKYLLSRDRQSEAVAVIHGLAYRNSTKTWLTEQIMEAVAEGAEGADGACELTSAATRVYVRRSDDNNYIGYDATSSIDLDNENAEDHHEDGDGVALVGNSSARRHRGRAATTGSPKKGLFGVVRDKLQSFSGDRLRPLFRQRQLATATVIIWFVWATIGMGYPLFNAFLPQYLSHGGSSSSSSSSSIVARTDAPSSVTYRNYAITSIVGVPGSLLAAYTVDNPSPFLGRRGTLASSTVVSAVFLFLFATLGHSPGTQLFFSCVEAFSQNIMYGVLYAFTPEIFPAPVRGAGTGVASFLNRITGLVAPVIAATLPGDGATGPIYLSAALILSAFFGMVLIPIETRGRQRL